MDPIEISMVSKEEVLEAVKKIENKAPGLASIANKVFKSVVNVAS